MYDQNEKLWYNSLLLTCQLYIFFKSSGLKRTTCMLPIIRNMFLHPQNSNINCINIIFAESFSSRSCHIIYQEQVHACIYAWFWIIIYYYLLIKMVTPPKDEIQSIALMNIIKSPASKAVYIYIYIYFHLIIDQAFKVHW